MTDFADIARGQGSHGNCFAIKSGELDLVTRAAVVHEHDRADVAARQAMRGQIALENHLVKLSDHVPSASVDGR